METAWKFLKENIEVAFATVGQDGKPKIRVFQIMKFGEDSLYFATAPGKEVYSQLKEIPAVELLSMSGNISVRVAGDVLFDVPDETGREIYDNNPVLPRLYGNYRELVYFRLAVRSLDYFDLSTDTPTLRSFKL
ncbi:MAG: pyridoxamine 5'-phosphate oxidase family protein [Rikenellaceae bacterium]|nr:pyridoxamine 5'-phosphate oxidase family protein [Rikenellaceae bacterium]